MTENADLERVVDRHLRAGWWGVATFVLLGVVLELLHAIKAPFYLDAGRETTRLLLRLAHAHGTLVSLLNIAFALTLRSRPGAASSGASALLLAALVLLPGGFLLGGVWADHDPGLGVLLVPPGAIALLVSAAIVARRI